MAQPLCEASGPVDDDMRCAVCLDSWQKPLMVRPCEHIFCWHCVRDVTTCPECRGKIESFALPHRLIVKGSEGVQVRCTECGKDMPRSESYAHVCVPKVRTAEEAAQIARQSGGDAAAVAAQRARREEERRREEEEQQQQSRPAPVETANAECQTSAATSPTTDTTRDAPRAFAQANAEGILQTARYRMVPPAIGSAALDHLKKLRVLAQGATEVDVRTILKTDSKKSDAASTTTFESRRVTLIDLARSLLKGMRPPTHSIQPPPIRQLAAGPQLVDFRWDFSCDCAVKTGECHHVRIRFDGCLHVGCITCMRRCLERRWNSDPYPPFAGVFVLPLTMRAAASSDPRGFESDNSIVPFLRCPVCVGLGLGATECGRLDSRMWDQRINTGVRRKTLTETAIDQKKQVLDSCATCGFPREKNDDAVAMHCTNCKATVCPKCGLTPGTGCIHIANPSGADVALACRAFVTEHALPSCTTCGHALAPRTPGQKLADAVETAMHGICYRCGTFACLLCGATATDDACCFNEHLQIVREILTAVMGDDAQRGAVEIMSAVTAIRAIALGRAFFGALFRARPDFGARYPVATLVKHGFPLRHALLRCRPHSGQAARAVDTAKGDPLLGVFADFDAGGKHPDALWHAVRAPERDRENVLAPLRIFVMPGVVDEALAPVVSHLATTQIYDLVPPTHARGESDA